MYNIHLESSIYGTLYVHTSITRYKAITCEIFFLVCLYFLNCMSLTNMILWKVIVPVNIKSVHNLRILCFFLSQL